MMCYVTAIVAFVCGIHQAQGASRFYDFLKNYILQFHCILLLFDTCKQTFVLSNVLSNKKC